MQKINFFLVSLIFAIAFSCPLPSLEKQTFGTWDYFAEEPVSIQAHFKNMEMELRVAIRELSYGELGFRSVQDDLMRYSASHEEYERVKNGIPRGCRELKYTANFHYQKTLVNILEYVDPYHIPKGLAWGFANILPLFGIFQNAIAGQPPVENEYVKYDIYQTEKNLFNVKMSVLPGEEENSTYHLLCSYIDSFEPEIDFARLNEGYHVDHELEENVKLLNLYQTSFLFFSYYFGFSESSPPILHHTNLETIAYDPDLTLEFEAFIERELPPFNETKWIEALQKLDQPDLEHICRVFRSFYHLILQNRNSLPESYLSLASHLSNIITKVLLPAQKNGKNNIDAINPWMFRLYMDLKNWESLLSQDETIPVPQLELLLPEIEQRCLKLMPPGVNLEHIWEANEFLICELVRMRNLTPGNQGDLDRGEEIFDEFEFNTYVMRASFIDLMNFLFDRAHFAKGDWAEFTNPGGITEEIYNYLSGFIEINDMTMTEDNVLDYLLEVKLFDLLIEIWNSHYPFEISIRDIHYNYKSFKQFYFPRTTFELRKLILKLCPYLKTYEVLTTSLDPDRVNEAKDQTKPHGWIEESEKARQQCIEELLRNAQVLYDFKEQSRLNNLVVGVRGISASGKSTFLKKNILPLIMTGDDDQIEELSRGILNVDTIKAALKQLQGGTLNLQVHEEASVAFKKFFMEFAEKGSYILDMRHLTLHDVMISLVEPAKKKNNSAWLYDFDVSLTTCLSRILTRPVHGIEPCPEYDALIDGFLSVRRHRSQLVEFVVEEETIAKYELYATSKQKCVARKENGELCIYDPKLFEECLRIPSNLEMERELSQVIDDVFIAKAIAKGDISEGQRELLEQRLGLTLKEAVQLHVSGDFQR